MYVMQTRNVREALRRGLNYLIHSGRREETRNGVALVAPMPVMTVTEHPRECVLLSPVRDANPFFHMYEAMWMLAGRDDVKPLQKFVKDFDKFADGPVIHGAYGKRWREHFGYDQLKEVIKRLRENTQDRQCVITMWDPYSDMPGGNDLLGNWRDRPCNTHIYLRVNSGMLDMTICCRSNDAIWGAHGANAVHFSFLQQYLAAQINVGVGWLYQLSNNYHAYDHEIDRLMRRAKLAPQYRELLPDALLTEHIFGPPQDIFASNGLDDEDIQTFVKMMDEERWNWASKFHGAWFNETLMPAMTAHDLFKKKEMNMAILMTEHIQSEDWRVACREWLERRRRA